MPVAITLLATVPLGISLLSVALDLLMLAQFGRTFGVRVPPAHGRHRA